MTDPLGENALEARFEGIPFPVSDVTTNGSRSHVAHTGFRTDGADLENTGLDAYQGTMTVPMINSDALVRRFGTVFPDLRNRLVSRLEQSGVGRLTHPIRGPMDAMITAWPEVASAKTRGGTMLTLTFIEHKASSLILMSEAVDNTPQDFESVASSQASASDAAMAAADPTNSFTPTAPVVATQLGALSTAVTFGAIDAAIRTMLAVVGTNIALAAFAAPSTHVAVDLLYTLQSTLYGLRNRSLGQLARARVITTSRNIAAWEIAVSEYGDQSLSDLIMQANNFEDALAIPAGAAVIVPPNPNG